MSATVLQIYAEMIPLADLAGPPFVGNEPLLGQMRTLGRTLRGELELELVLRVTVDDQPIEPALLELLADPARLGVDRIRVWPQLPHHLGVWLSAPTMEAWFDHVHRWLDRCDAHALPAPFLLYDLEPPFAVVRALTAGGVGRWQEIAAASERLRRGNQRHEDDVARLADHVASLVPRAAAHPLAHTAAVAPLGWGWVRRAVERALQTPLARRGNAIFGAHEAMCYGSALEYFLPKALAARSANWLVGRAAAMHRRDCDHLENRAGIILGCTSAGLLGDEPAYASARALAEAARAAGGQRLDRVGIYNLRGLVASPGQSIGSRDWRPWIVAALG